MKTPNLKPSLNGKAKAHTNPVQAEGRRPILITGGAGFIGSNLAGRLLASGERVILFDNLSRAGVEHNLQWLRTTYERGLTVEVADIRDRYALRSAVQEAKQVFHFAAQVAVTTGLKDPVSDFEINARGTLNLLEELRTLSSPPGLVFTSTNKVYGELRDVELHREPTRYVPKDRHTRNLGIDESRHLDFHSPYGCSKGCADQYVLDYARVYGLPATVFRMSCIYGPHQFGTEDQGWIAHFLIRAVDGDPITIYGDGLQVRDALFIEDLLDAFVAAQASIDHVSGCAFNIGGGPANTLSLLELMEIISDISGTRPKITFDPWRAGDQKYYVSDVRRFQSATAWLPKTDIRTGVRMLYRWLMESRGISQPSVFVGMGAK